MTALTVYLLRQDIKSLTAALEGLPQEIPIKNKYGIHLGTLYLKSMPEKNPSWAPLFTPYTGSAFLGKVQATSAAYLLEAGGRIFALTFGHGRHLLRSDSVDERFGLLVVLNSVEEDKLRSIDKRTFDAVDQNSRVQVSQQSPAAEFGIDIEKDLIRGVTGQPSDDSLGSRMSGSDALSVSVKKVTLETLPALLLRYLEKSEATQYRDSFGWVDHIHQVKAKGKTSVKLDAELILRIENARRMNGEVVGAWLAIPDIVDYSKAERFRYRGGTVQVGSFSDLRFRDFFKTLSGEEHISLDLLRSCSAYAIDENGFPASEKWPIYKCIHGEIELDGNAFVLANGQWYRVKREFRDDVDSYYRSISRYSGTLPPYEHTSEEAYNKSVCASDIRHYALMDRKLIKVGGVRDKIEFCDIYTLTHELWHIKLYGGSSQLGHAFNQGLVSAELLRDDKDYVRKVNAKLPSSHQLVDSSRTPRDTSSYSIIFGIISEQSGPALTIPFFARVALKHVHKRLMSMGYTKIILAKIAVTDEHARLEKVKPSRKGKRR